MARPDETLIALRPIVEDAYDPPTEDTVEWAPWWVGSPEPVVIRRNGSTSRALVAAGAVLMIASGLGLLFVAWFQRYLEGLS